jgi:steroid delta-isomerase-like uncharacterized protein
MWGALVSECCLVDPAIERSKDMTVLATDAVTTEEIVELALKQVAAFNSGDWEQLGAGLASDCHYDEFGTQRKIDGPEKIVELFKAWKTAFPDAVGTVTNRIASGNKAALELTWKGTHTGPLATAEGTIPASGKVQETPAAFFFTFEGDKVKESRHYFDAMTLLKQIGAAA